MTILQSSVQRRVDGSSPQQTAQILRRKPVLNDVEQSVLEEALCEPIDYIHHPSFDEDDAEKRIFDDAPEIPVPNTNWYGPVMDTGVPQRARNSKNAVLSAEQEQALFLQFNYARCRATRLQKQAAIRPLSYVRSRQLIYWHRKASDLRDHIAQVSLALVLAMAKRVRAREIEFSDLVSEGNVALMMAIGKFDVGKGFKFSTYACRAILSSFSRKGMKEGRHRRLFPAVYDPAWEGLNYRQIDRTEYDHDRADALRHFVEENKAELTDIERAIIHHRFSISNVATKVDEKPMTLEQVGKMVGLTRERVRQLQKSALRKLRRVIEQHQEEDLCYWGRPSGRGRRRRKRTPAVMAYTN